MYLVSGKTKFYFQRMCAKTAANLLEALLRLSARVIVRRERRFQRGTKCFHGEARKRALLYERLLQCVRMEPHALLTHNPY